MKAAAVKRACILARLRYRSLQRTRHGGQLVHSHAPIELTDGFRLYVCEVGHYARYTRGCQRRNRRAGWTILDARRRGVYQLVTMARVEAPALRLHA